MNLSVFEKIIATETMMVLWQYNRMGTMEMDDLRTQSRNIRTYVGRDIL